MNNLIQDFINLRKGKETGGCITFAPHFLRDFLHELNGVVFYLNIGFGNVHYDRWRRITAYAYVNNDFRPIVRFSAFIDDNTPRYRLSCYSGRFKRLLAFEFHDVYDREKGLVASLREVYGNQLDFKV